jgi:hypothetical protein
VLVIASHPAGVPIRPFYSRYRPGRTFIPATRYNGLHHDSYLSERAHPIAAQLIGDRVGTLGDHHDPYGDFAAA